MKAVSLLSPHKARAPPPRYSTLLASLGTYAYDAGHIAACLAYAQRVLSHDPFRDDAHRLLMHCYVRQGERACQSSGSAWSGREWNASRRAEHADPQ